MYDEGTDMVISGILLSETHYSSRSHYIATVKTFD